MSNIVTPQNQSAHISSFSGRIFEFDTISSKYYIARTLNENLISHGVDCLLTGLVLQNITYDPSTDLISATITSGKAIADMTLIEILEDVTLFVDVSPFEDSGSIVIALSYRFLETVYKNPAKLKIFYLHENGINTVPEFQTDYERLILGQLKFNKVDKTVTAITTNHKTPVDISINNKNYRLRNMSDLMSGTLDYMSEKFKLRDI